MRSFLCISLGWLAALYMSTAHGAWMESAVVPVRLDPAPAMDETVQQRTLSTEEREKVEERRIYQLDAFGKRIVLDLEPDQTFLATGFVFQMIGQPESPDPETQRVSDSRAMAGCFFSGQVNGETDSAAALNVCHGLRGGFYADGEECFIQPDSDTDSGASDSSLHILRCRSRKPHAEDGGSKCGVNEEEERQPLRKEKGVIADPAAPDHKGISVFQPHLTDLSVIWI